MAINAGAIKNNGAKKFAPQPKIEDGNYPARLVQVIDLGLQPQRPYQGEAKPPAHEVMFTFELVDCFMIDEEGNEILDKPRWQSITMPLRALGNEKAKSTKLAKALDPEGILNGDFSQMIGFPLMITLGSDVKGDKIYTNVLGFAVMRARDIAKCPELINPTKVFDLDQPDLEVFNSFPEWIREKIKGNLEYQHSALQRLLEGNGVGGVGKKEEAPEGDPEAEEQEAADARAEGAMNGEEDLPW